MEGATVPYELIALDLDGTTIDHDLIIQDAVREVVVEARAQGVRVTIATGRQYVAALPFARILGITEPLICHQGALIRNPIDDTILLHQTMPPKEAAEAAAALRDADIFTIAYVDDRLHITGPAPELDYYLRFHPEGTETVIVPDLPAFLATTAPTKLLFVAEGPIVEEQLARLSVRFAHRIALTRSHERFGELTALGVSKGAALAHLAQAFGIARERTVAIGDQENDLPMLRWAGLGLAMGNAIPAVQKEAAAVLPTVAEAGVAYGIREYVLTGWTAPATP